MSRTLLLVIAVGMSAHAVYACDTATTLSQAMNRASEKIHRGQPIAALSCYREFLTAEAFDSAPINIQERFLSEYLDHCRNLANRARGAKRHEYLKEAHEIANRYLDWFTACRPATDRVRGHVRAVAFYLGDASVSGKDQSQVLADYERLSRVLPEALGTQAIALWDEVLRTVPGATRYLEDNQARALALKTPMYSRHWRVFRAFLQTLANSSDTATFARDELAHIDAILVD